MRYHIAFLVCMSAFLVATSVGQPRERIEQSLKDLTEKVQLTTQQQDTIRQILEESTASMREARQTASGNREEMMQLMRTIQARTDARIDAVLTADQKPAYEKYKEDRRKTMKEQRRDGGMPPGGRR